MHQPSCRHYAVQRNVTTTIGARGRLKLGKFLSGLVELSFCCSTGAGGLAIGPTLRWTNVVPEDRCRVIGEFKKLSDWLDMRRESEAIAERLKSLRMTLRRLYSEKKASPNDVDTGGLNHLQKFVKYIVCLLDYEFMTAELVSSTTDIILDYLEIGLRCDEPDTRMGPHKHWRSFVAKEVSTTLATSLIMLVPYGGKVAVESTRIVNCVAKASDPVLEDVAKMMAYADSGLVFQHALDNGIGIDITPVARAILSRSLEDLEYQIQLSPKSVLKKTFGLTTLHLAVDWPQGLAKLIMTDARLFIDEPADLAPRGWDYLVWPFSYASVKHCAASLDILLSAGCDLFPGDDPGEPLSVALRATSADCAKVIATHLARRRADLFTIAKAHLAIIRQYVSRPQHNSTDNIPSAGVVKALESPESSGSALELDAIAVAVCLILDDAKVPYPKELRVPPILKDGVYQLPLLPPNFFPIFEACGFQGYNHRDSEGLTPIMSMVRWLHPVWTVTVPDDNSAVIPWMIKHNCLDMQPEDPLRLGLNTHVTGWHYLAMFTSQASREYTKSGEECVSKADPELLEHIQTAAEDRDICSCWCNVNGLGCSPFSIQCKTYLNGALPVCRNRFRHYIFRHGKYKQGESPSSQQTITIPRWQLEFLRLLTFEALEMTHTCCKATSNKTTFLLEIILDCEPEIVRRIRGEPSEQDRARQLDALMTEFIGQLEATDMSALAFEQFIFGYWASRIAGLYAVSGEVVREMNQVLHNVKTRK
ncbi:hypothetical protein VPNG_05366 [Cytospora leucostoma]|uniref:Uncharacterized protein n=1 Tax=Cytospora leucostoma TaxID=1230097 RepID=A0A423X4P4_9PEZI|nr:hypothetical protein VPNG_05366 [Cytospora leucostoma]